MAKTSDVVMVETETFLLVNSAAHLSYNLIHIYLGIDPIEFSMVYF